MAEDYRRWERRLKGGPVPSVRTGVALTLCLLLVAGLAWFWSRGSGKGPTSPGLTTFSSEEEFSDYLSSSQEWLGGYWGTGYPLRGGWPSPVRALEEGERASRLSETTVQVRGIDEPDVVKTDGRNLYFSGSLDTKLIRAFPPSDLSVASRLEKNGELLLLENLLILLSYGEIAGYRVSDPSSPQEAWRAELNSTLVSARLRQGKLYLVTSTPVDRQTPLPLRPLRTGEVGLVVRANDIYRPPQPMPADSVYTALVLDPREGRVERSLSFLGYSGSSVVYMSEESLYLTYTYHPSPVRVFHEFLRERGGDLLPQDLLERIERLMGYEISDTAKLVELNLLLSSTSPSQELWKEWEGYLTERKRELEITHLVKISLENFEIVAQAEVPGRPLNQFSLDEREGYLRLATTVEPWMLGTEGESSSDVYLLDRELRVVGSLKDLGPGEEIYAVRFLGDRGYVVTFRETDPLHVLDLSDPSHPRVAGELKMPGYSSYLHPIDENLLLGIGREDWKVKVSLFDVSSPSSPLELDRLLLEEYWSEVLETHHAFLLDPDHRVFFLPSWNKGYVLSYDNRELEVVGKVDGVTARRALYLDEYLYVVSEEGLTVLDERTWETVNQLWF